MKNIPIRVVTDAQNKTEASEAIAKKWLEDSARTATALDFDAHMQLISRQVAVHGVPDLDIIRYDDWAKQCRHEFAGKVLEKVTYRGFKLVGRNDNRIMFKTVECIKPRGANTVEQGLEVIIEEEKDGVWRVIQERILSAEEVAHDGILDEE